jgi:PAS domain S-box-containing protein
MDTARQVQGSDASLEQELQAMASRLSDLRSKGAASTEDLVTELETAMEELRVTSEEIGAQQRHISDLLRQSAQSQATVQRLITAVPTPVLTTDPDGALEHVNNAAARLLGVAAERLVGKPLAAFVEVADRRIVRTMVSVAAEGRAPEPALVNLSPRGDGRHPVTLVAVPVGHGHDESAGRSPVRWFIDVTPQADGSGAALALLESFAELVAMPVDDPSPAAVAREVVTVARRALPEAVDVTLTVGDPRAPELLSSGSPLAQEADAAQLESGEGPCVDAFLTDQVVASDDLRGDPRWPLLARNIERTPINATVGVPLHSEDGVLGVLNVYGTAGTRLDEPSVRTRAELFGRAASALVQDSRRIALLQQEAHHLRRALVSRPEIDQAKGILMARFGYSADDAFRHLVAVSQKRNVKLRDVAREVVEMVQRGSPPAE